MAGNKYIIWFVHWLTGYAEVFLVKYKTAKPVDYVIIGKTFPRYGAMRTLVSDSGGEFVNEVIKHMYVTRKLNIPKVETHFYSPKSNSKLKALTEPYIRYLSIFWVTRLCKHDT